MRLLRFRGCVQGRENECAGVGESRSICPWYLPGQLGDYRTWGYVHMSMCDLYSVPLYGTGHEESNSWADIV